MASPLPSIDDRLLSRNLEALRAIDPALADRLIHVDLTAVRPTPAMTRDGQVSFRLTDADGGTCWLGRTSIPTVRAAAMIELFDPGDANVFLPSLGEGTEVKRLLANLQSHQRVFVWEPDALTVRLVLALHDYAENLRAGRFVPLVCPQSDLTAALVEWLDRHPSVSPPGRMMVWPGQSRAEITALRSVLEATWAQTQTRRAEKTVG